MYASINYLAPMTKRLLNKRKRLYTQHQLAALLGCSPTTIVAMEKSFLTKRQRAYLDACGYTVGFYPLRKEAREKEGDEGAPPR